MNFITLVALISLATSDPITKRENLALKQRCGKTVLNVWRKYKSYGGRNVKANEFPWLAKIFVQRAGTPSPSLCGGAQISSRHILTAAHCVFEEIPEEIVQAECEKRKEDRKLVYNTLPVKSFTIYVGSKCINIEDCMQPNDVAGVSGHYEYNECDHSHDIAVIELKNDLPARESSPICMPEKQLKLAKTLRSAGSGVDHGENVYTDVRNHLKWICIHTGVCWDDTNTQLDPHLDVDEMSGTNPGDQNPSMSSNYAHRQGKYGNQLQTWGNAQPGVWPNNQYNYNTNSYGTYNTAA
ncbi:hypothetical protein OESDEN_03881 [Oesophagostomum dentatum]|uniref:Peptidase S1 domain-containing protein n=1 Tax=Oesophagostomum dentatum TaxID=61180 RepID=A0A0B1TLB6_OESDE|nr:hypothetical protein OESDEN_03881 [Oesophagostomum dentatum]